MTASTTGHRAHASTTGDEAHASTTGVGAHASTTGHRAHASTTGHRAHASTTGDEAHASTTGHRAHASTTGDEAHASTTGHRAHAMSACGAAAAVRGVSVGRWVKLSTEAGGTDGLVLPAAGHRPMLVSVHDGWPADTWITMTGDGQVVTRPDVLLPDDGRGYRVTVDNGGRYNAGCRGPWDIDQCRQHWGAPSHPDPHSARLILAAIEEHHARTVTA